VAESLKSGFKKIGLHKLPAVGKHFKNFSTRDWVSFSVFFNDLPYYAHLGLRPFAAMRNLLQPFITTGPLIGNRWLARGYQESFNPAAKEWIRKNRLLQESLGEWERSLYRFEESKVDKFTDFLMALFRKSDEINRYAAGLGMRAKVDHYWNKLGGPTEEFFTKIKLRRFRDSVREEVRNLSRVYRAKEEMAKYNYPEGNPRRVELERLIKRLSGKPWYASANSLENLKEKIRVRLAGEAIGDTQWLYGKEHAPLFTFTGGAAGRAAGVYQTWWLNYTQFVNNLFRRASDRDIAPLATWAANNIILTLAMIGAGWEASKAVRTVGLGPFPTKIPFTEMPPGVEPIARLMESGQNLLLRGDIETAEKRFETFLKRAWDNWMPGSLFYKELARVGWTPQFFEPITGKRLTPLPTERYKTTFEKLESVIGGKGRK